MPEPILIACVDDDDSIREALKGLLSTFGYDVEVFASAEDFLSFDRRRAVSCLIADMKLGGMSGLELQGALRASNAAIPTVLITAFGDARLRDQAMDGGAIEFLRKPIAEDRLMDSVNLALAAVRDLAGQASRRVDHQ